MLYVHYKNGKFAIWNTVVDAYVTDWCEDQDFIIAEWMGLVIFREMKIVKDQIVCARRKGKEVT